MMVAELTPAGYLTLMAKCRTQNEFNRLHIGLETFLAPRELADIVRLADSASLPPPAVAWLEKARQASPALVDAPQSFRRRAVFTAATLYSDPEAATRGKRLAVMFKGIARRLMMPTPIFLQHIDAQHWDVVLLSTTQGASFVRGVDSTHRDVPSLVHHVASVIDPAQYKGVTTFGTSGGGYAGAWAAILMGAQRGVSVSGAPPRTSPEPTTGRRPVVYQPGGEPHGVDLRFVFGAGHAHDRQSALLLREIFGGELWPVPDVAVHNVLWKLLERGQLADFLNQALS